MEAQVTLPNGIRVYPYLFPNRGTTVMSCFNWDGDPRDVDFGISDLSAYPDDILEDIVAVFKIKWK